MITREEAVTKKDLKRFVTYPFSLYKHCSYEIPSFIKDELETMNPDLNPVFKNADAWFYMAYRIDRIVGRIAVIINHLEVNEQGKMKIRSGWIDLIDDIDVTRALLEKAFEKCR